MRGSKGTSVDSGSLRFDRDERPVLHVTAHAFGRNGFFGGGERYPLELATAMAAIRPTRLAVFGDRKATDRIGNLEVLTLPTRVHYHGSEVNPLSEGLIKAIASSSVVHMHQWDTLLANVTAVLGRALRKKVVATDHGGFGENFRRELRLHRMLQAFLPVSEFSEQQFPEFAGRSEVILGGVDSTKYRPGLITTRRDRVVFVGRLLPHKGIDVLIDAVPDSLELVVIGQPYDEEYFRYLKLRAAGKNVRFDTSSTDDGVIAAFQSCRLVVMPSVYNFTLGGRSSKPELLSLTLLEAMACATPVVCTSVGGMPEIVIDGVTGRIVPPGDSMALREVVVQLSHGGAEWDHLSAGALSRARSLSWTAVAEHCLAIYRSGTVQAGSLRSIGTSEARHPTS